MGPKWLQHFGLARDHIYGDKRQRIMATSMARVAEFPCLNVGHEFERRVLVLFLQSPLSSSCVARERVQVVHQLA